MQFSSPTPFPQTTPTGAAPDMGALAGLVKHDLASAASHPQQDRPRRSKASSSHFHDPNTAQQVQRLLACMERAPHDWRLAAQGLNALLRDHLANERAAITTACTLLLQPGALRVLWDAAQLHALHSPTVLESFLATFLHLTQHHTDRAVVRRALPAYAPALLNRLRTRVDRGSARARALEKVARRIGVVFVAA